MPARIATLSGPERRAGRLFAPYSPGDQPNLPGFSAPETMRTPVLPLVLYDLGVGKTVKGGSQGAPLALRLFVESVLSVPHCDRLANRPVAMEVPLREFVTCCLYPPYRLEGGVWVPTKRGPPRPAEYWPRLIQARDALNSPESEVSWWDKDSGTGGRRQIVMISGIPSSPSNLGECVRLVVDLPPGSEVGPVPSANLPKWGMRRAAHYRALLGLAYRWFNPGVTRIPVRGGKHWVQSQDPRRYDKLRDDELVAMCFPTSTSKVRRNLLSDANKVMRELAHADELRIVDGRLLPPARVRRC